MCLQALTLEHSTSFPLQAPGMVADIIYYVAVFAQGLIRQTKFRAMAAAIKRSTTLQSFLPYFGMPGGRATVAVAAVELP